MQVSSPLSQAARFQTSHNATAISQQEDSRKKNAINLKDYHDEMIAAAQSADKGDGSRGSLLDVTV